MVNCLQISTKTCFSGGRCGIRGFTIIELLVVVGVIAVLMGILLPAVHQARGAAAMTLERAAARDLMVGYLLYADANDERVLPGYKTELPAYDERGTPLEDITIPAVAARYPWRIAPYINYSFRTLYRNAHGRLLEEMEQTSYENYIYVVSLSPSLGINSAWVGGDQNELGFNATAIRAYGTFYVRSLTEAVFPDRLMVFASARGLDPLNVEGVAAPVEGYFKVQSPWFSASGGDRWASSFEEANEPGEYGFVSLRHRKRAVTAFIDGHVGALGAVELRDMRYWANRASKREWGIEPN